MRSMKRLCQYTIQNPKLASSNNISQCKYKVQKKRGLFVGEGMENDVVILSEIYVKHYFYLSVIDMLYNKEFESSLIKLNETEKCEKQ